MLIMPTNSKKSQTTIFVILGVIILIALAAATYTFIHVKIKKPKVPLLPEDVEKVRSFIDSCLASTAKEAFIELGKHGGYLTNQLNTVKGFDIIPNADEKIALWLYSPSDLDCEQCQVITQYPSLSASVNGIDSQVSEYVKQHIDSCTQHLDSFKNQFEVVEGDVESLKIDFNKDKVSITMKRPYAIIRKADKTRTEIKEFQSAIDLNFERIYNLATDIMFFELYNGFLENRVREALALKTFGYNKLMDYPIPPVNGGTITRTVFNDKPVFWIKSKVKNIVREILQNSVAAIKVTGTSNSKIFVGGYNPSRQVSDYDSTRLGFVFRNLINIPKKDFVGILSTDFSFLPWSNLDLKIKPGGEIITPKLDATMPPNVITGIIPMLKLIQTKTYDINFLYSIKAPILVRLYDPTAFNNQGYTLQYGIEFNMINNQPLYNLVNYTQPVFEENSNIFCNPENFNTEEYSIITTYNDGKPIDNVSVFYSCGDNDCYIGKTRLINGTAVLKSRLPICYNGYLWFKHEEGVADEKRLSTEIGKAETIDIKFYKPKKVTIKFKEKPVVKELSTSTLKLEWVPKPYSFRDLSQDETANIIFSRTKTVGGTPILAAIVLNNTQTQSTVSLIPGNYSVFIMVNLGLGEGYSRQKIHLHDEIHYDPEPLNPFCCDEIQNIDYDLNTTTPLGILQFNGNETPYFKIGNELYNYSELTFYSFVINAEDLSKPQDLEQITKTQDYANQYLQQIMPKWV